jgi:hypothetical protein
MKSAKKLTKQLTGCVDCVVAGVSRGTPGGRALRTK